MRGRGGRGGGGWRRKREEKSNLGGADSEEEELVRLRMEEEEEEENEREEEEMEDDEEEEDGVEMGDEWEEEDVNVEEEERERKDESLQEQQKPKLDEGFYEIEDVRKRRVRKGQVQYLIKWRGWSETAKTWEPLENLQSCSDVIDAFEESLRSGKSRRRKRKSGGSLTQPKKKQQRSTSSLSGSKVGRRPGPLSSVSIDSSTPSSLRRSDRIVVKKSVNRKDPGNGKSKSENGQNLETTTHQTENDDGSSNICPQDEQNEGEIDDPKLIELKGIDTLNSENGKLSIIFSDTRVSDKDGLTDGVSKAEFGEPVKNNRFTGARRRKAGCVRRFKNDLASLEPDEAQNGIPRSTVEFGDKLETIRVEDGEVPLGGDAGGKNKLENSIYASPITKIIKTISYSALISNNVQDVSVTFVAMRANGKEVVVDNKFLKANNPQLLISFYEQHVRYNSFA